MDSLSQQLFDAISDGDVDVVRRRLTTNPWLAESRNGAGISAVMWAKYHHQEEALKALLALEPRLDIFDAAAVGRTERCAELLHADASLINERSADGFSALHLAAFFGHEPVVRQLLAAGADPNMIADNALKVMPLHSAVAGRHLHTTTALIEGGADVNAAQGEGYTALHEAVENGSARLVEVLIAAGADPHRAMDDGRTPIDMAAAKGDAGIITLLDSPTKGAR